MKKAGFIDEVTEPLMAPKGELTPQDKVRLTELYNTYADEIGGYLRHITPSQDVAEDMLAETFIGLARVIHQKRDVQNMRAYLYMIARNKVNDFYRSKKRLEQPDDDRISSDRDLDLSEERAEDRILAIRETLLHLEETHQEILILHDLEGFKQREIAEKLDIPMGTVNSRIRAARKKFIEVFQQVSQNEGGFDDRP